MGYKFYMLLKRLLRQVASILPWVIGCAVIVGAIVLVARQHHAATEKYEAAREERCASSFPFDSEKQETCKHERDGPGNYLPWGYELVAWPEGITAWLLLATLGGIFWQAKSTQQSVDAVRRSVEVQEAEFVQWVDMGDCAIEYDRAVYQLGRSHVSGTPAMQVCGHPGPMKMRFSFPLLNNTTRPLFIKSVRTVLTIGPQKTIKTFLTEEGRLVPPKDEYRVVIDMTIDNDAVTQYIAYSLFIETAVHVQFSNALQKPGEVAFLRLFGGSAFDGASTVSKGHIAHEAKA